MTSETSGKMEMPSFIKIPVVMVTEANPNIGEKKAYIKAEARINPVMVSSYFPAQYDEGGDKHSITCVVVGGHYHYVDMEIDKFDIFIKNTDRSYNLDFIESR